jgi:hypothetical protein
LRVTWEEGGGMICPFCESNEVTRGAACFYNVLVVYKCKCGKNFYVSEFDADKLATFDESISPGLEVEYKP